MTLDGYHSDVMRSKSLACWGFFVGFVLNLVVARECFTFKDHITDNLLKDHWFEFRHFQHSGETVKEGYTLLSIVNMMCTSLKKYGDLYYSESPGTANDSRVRVKWSYKDIVEKFLNLSFEENVLTACEKHACNFSFGTSYISPDQLDQKYNNVCNWTGPLAACPSPQNTSHSPSQVSHTTSSPSPTYPLTSTPTHTTSHQSTSTTTSSSSQPRNMTSPSPSTSNNTETPPACQPLPSNNCSDNTKNEARVKGNEMERKDKSVLLSLLLTVSCTVNAVLLMAVWWLCKKYGHQKNLLNCSENNHQLTERTCLQDRKQREENGISSSPST